MLPHGLVFSNESDGAFDYLDSSSVGITPPQWLLGQGSFQKLPEIAGIKKDACSSFPVPLPLLCQGISGSSWFSSQMKVTLPSLSKVELFAWIFQVRGSVVQNSFSLHPYLKLFLLWFILSGYAFCLCNGIVIPNIFCKQNHSWLFAYRQSLSSSTDTHS